MPSTPRLSALPMTTLLLRALTALLALFVLAPGRLLAAGALPGELPAGFTLVSETWYASFLGEEQIGWEHERVLESAETLRVEHINDMTMRRLGSETHIRMESTEEEDRQGALRSMSLKMFSGDTPMETLWTVEGDQLLERSTQGDRVLESKHPFPKEPIVTSLGARRLLQQVIREGKHEVEYASFSPEAGLRVMKVKSVFDRVDGYRGPRGTDPEQPVSVWRTELALTPAPVIQYLNPEGVPQRQDITLGVFTMSSRATTKELALGKTSGDLKADIMLQTFVEMKGEVASPNTLEGARFEIHVREGLLPEIPSAGSQRVLKILRDGRSARVDVDITRHSEASLADRNDPEYLGSSSLVDPKDTVIQELAARALEGPELLDDMARADKLRAFVRQYINRKSLGVAFASASDVARNRKGDCTEHAMLLAALLRAQGIPSRLATGLVYIDSFQGHKQVFGWHAWTQAIIDGHWVDLDPTLDLRYHPLHLFLGATSLAHGRFEADLIAEVSLMGNLDIELLELRPLKGQGASLPSDDDRVKVGKGTLPPLRKVRRPKVEIIVFDDFQCPFCDKNADELARLQELFGDKIGVWFRDFPLDSHVDAMGAHLAARCANEQGRFRSYHDLLMNNQQALKPEDLLRYAEDMGMQPAQFLSCMGSRRHAPEIEADRAEGRELGVVGVPCTFVNGRRLKGSHVQEMQRLVERELGLPVSPD